ncbi:DUF3093 domain-containing protein [Microbacterium sp. W1N]|uniref:DUF3093 domain-containing protein n=1 Tax=Microbacterium festucae TaxID=2977531 RepID=UPI0021C0FFA9|nr:DUF3093 domain-containing protein [Microbacterium festucae]MCT9820074.1 DUF3093 domain-containing protein [Microbacterium festucae]
MSDLSAATVRYRERLSPSLWALVSAAVSAPMVALVFVPMDATFALVIGLVVAAALIALLIAAAPSIAVEGGELRVGRGHVPVEFLGEPEVFTGAEAREMRGPGLGRDVFHMLRGGIDGVVRVPLNDADDPVTAWVFSSRTPDRVAAAIRRAQQQA